MAAVLRGRAELADVRSFIGELYGPDLHALRVHPRHDVLDQTILAARVHRLKAAQQRPSVLGIELGLMLAQCPSDDFTSHLSRL